VGCVHLQLCEIMRPFPGKVVHRKWKTLQESRIGVTGSGHFLFSVARGTSDAGRGLCHCGRESGVKASGLQHGLSLWPVFIWKNPGLERSTVL